MASQQVTGDTAIASMTSVEAKDYELQRCPSVTSLETVVSDIEEDEEDIIDQTTATAAATIAAPKGVDDSGVWKTAVDAATASAADDSPDRIPTSPSTQTEAEEGAETETEIIDLTTASESDPETETESETETEREEPREEADPADIVQREVMASRTATASAASDARTSAAKQEKPQTTPMMLVTFDSYADLSTRLVLMPRVEEEGVGAIVASCVTDGLRMKTVVPSPQSPIREDQQPAESTKEQPDDQPSARPSEGNADNDSSNSDNSNDISNSNSQLSGNETLECTGLSVVGMHGKPQQDLTNEEFSTILATIRQCGEQSIVLKLQKVVDDEDNDNGNPADNGTTNDTSNDNNNHNDNKHLQASASAESNTSGAGQSKYASWSAWGSRVRAQSEKLAMQANKAALIAKERAQQQLSTVTLDMPVGGTTSSGPTASSSALETPRSKRQSQQQQQPEPPLPDPTVYIQSSLGAFFAIDANTTRNSLKLTTSSLLVARISPTQPCPTHYRFQWYKSSCGSAPVPLPLTVLNDDASSVRSGGAGSATSATIATQPSATGHSEWIALDGATNASFQPNATLIGYRLQCVVVIPEVSDNSESSSAAAPPATHKLSLAKRLRSPNRLFADKSSNPRVDASNDDPESDLDDDCSAASNLAEQQQQQRASDSNSGEGGVSDDDDTDDDETIVCKRVVIDDLPKIAADMTLFNAARQALARGAKFGGLKGRGNAAGRVFGLEIKMAAHPTRRGRQRLSTNGSGIVASAMITQVVSNQAEPLSSKPLLQAAAVADAVQTKNLDLILPLLRPDGTPAVANTDMLQVLCTDGAFQLEAPNRLTRESILLALGIANYGGKPSQLTASTILFPEMAHSNLTASGSVAAMKNLLDDEASCLTTSSGASSPIISHVFPGASATPCTPPKSIHATSPRTSLPLQLNKPSSNADGAAGTHANLRKIDEAAQERIRKLEEELEFYRTKLTRKDKVVSELQRRLTVTDAANEKTNKSFQSCQAELQQSQAEVSRLNQENRQYREQQQSAEAEVARKQEAHDAEVAQLKETMERQAAELLASKKAQKSLQNDKAVLQAAVEARETKLSKMQTLQNSFRTLEEKVGQHEHLKKELEMSHHRQGQIKSDLDRVLQLETDVRGQLHMAQQTVDQLNERLQASEKKTDLANAELQTLKDKFHTMKMERNNYKAKGDSLSKEMTKLCRNGRTMKDVEKIVLDDESRKEEVEVLRRQKRQALEDAHNYRTSYEQSKIVAQQMQSTGSDTRKAIERSAELERLLAEMTEYVTAKEMQLETMRQVNTALQEEIHALAQANMNKNDI